MVTLQPQHRIDLSPPHLSGNELTMLHSALESGWIAPAGPHLDHFEHCVAEWIGTRHALALSSGTAALHLALLALKLQPGDEVICPTLTFCASANPILYVGARPVFIDSEPESWNLDPQRLEDELGDSARRGRLPRAVIAVDIFGQSADMDSIVQVADRYEIPVIEDAAEAFGSTYKGRSVGRAGWSSFLSFNGNKIITTGGGGMLCSDDSELIDQARFLATQARDPAPHYEHSQVGYNYRMSNVLAAVGLAQLDVLEDRVAARRRNFDFYQQQLGPLPGIAFMPEAPYGRTNRWLTVITIDPAAFGASRDEVRRGLAAVNIESRPVWKPLHLQPVFAGCRCRGGQFAEHLFQRGLCLPGGSAMTDRDLTRTTTEIEATPAKKNRLSANHKKLPANHANHANEIVSGLSSSWVAER